MINKKRFGYVFASKELFKENGQVGLFYHEFPDNPYDSGWRFFTGNETQEYCDNPQNIGIYNIESILKISPEIEEFLDEKGFIRFERQNPEESFSQV
jgi:hypothetical protein